MCASVAHMLAIIGERVSPSPRKVPLSPISKNVPGTPSSAQPRNSCARRFARSFRRYQSSRNGKQQVAQHGQQPAQHNRNPQCLRAASRNCARSLAPTIRATIAVAPVETAIASAIVRNTI